MIWWVALAYNTITATRYNLVNDADLQYYNRYAVRFRGMPTGYHNITATRYCSGGWRRATII